LRPTRLRITLRYDGQSHAVDDDDALVCSVCDDEHVGERAVAFLLARGASHRALAPHAETSATVSRTTLLVSGERRDRQRRSFI